MNMKILGDAERRNPFQLKGLCKRINGAYTFKLRCRNTSQLKGLCKRLEKRCAWNGPGRNTSQLKGLCKIQSEC